MSRLELCGVQADEKAALKDGGADGPDKQPAKRMKVEDAGAEGGEAEIEKDTNMTEVTDQVPISAL